MQRSASRSLAREHVVGEFLQHPRNYQNGVLKTNRTVIATEASREHSRQADPSFKSQKRWLLAAVLTPLLADSHAPSTTLCTMASPAIAPPAQQKVSPALPGT